MGSFGQFETAILILMVVLWLVPILAAVLVIVLLDMGKRDTNHVGADTAILKPLEPIEGSARPKKVSREDEGNGEAG